jgi:antitoxin Phd
MIIDTKQIISMTEASQNFSKTADKCVKNNEPKGSLVDINNYINLTDDEKIEIVAKRILNKHIAAFKELAK